MSEPVDQEIEAIKVVLAALAPLSEKARASVLDYVTRRLDLTRASGSVSRDPSPHRCFDAVEEAPLMSDHHRISRRHVLGMAIAAGGFAWSGAVSAVFAQALKRTPGEILGPFYPVLRTVEKTADLTALPGKPGRAAGQVIYVMGRVVNVQGEPLKGRESSCGKPTPTGATPIRVTRTGAARS